MDTSRLSECVVYAGGVLFHYLLLRWRFRIDLILTQYHKGGL
jgi:hypothetical protein